MEVCFARIRYQHAQTLMPELQACLMARNSQLQKRLRSSCIQNMEDCTELLGNAAIF